MFGPSVGLYALVIKFYLRMATLEDFLMLSMVVVATVILFKELAYKFVV